MSIEANCCRHLRVRGLVQGVFYRASTEQTALRLGLAGWVRNCANGDVELIACGPPARLDDLEQRLGLPPGGFNPKHVVIYICGLTGTITGTVIPLIDRGFVPDFKRIREALGVPSDIKDSVFYEQYDTEPVINIKDESVVAPLRERMAAALAKQLP